MVANQTGMGRGTQINAADGEESGEGGGKKDPR